MAGICAASPGLRVLKVVTKGAVLQVDGATGSFAGVPATLPRPSCGCAATKARAA
jgi:hypothetical protein